MYNYRNLYWRCRDFGEGISLICSPELFLVNHPYDIDMGILGIFGPHLPWVRFDIKKL